MDQIARRLNVSKAALYYYVRNKEQILYQCHRWALDLGVNALTTAEQLDAPPNEKLRFAIARFIEGVTDQMHSPAVLLEAGAFSGPLYRRMVHRRDAYERRLRTLIEAGIESGVFVPCNPKLTVFAILGAVNWIPRWYSADGPAKPKELAEMFSDYLVRGLERSRA